MLLVRPVRLDVVEADITVAAVAIRLLLGGIGIKVRREELRVAGGTNNTLLT